MAIEFDPAKDATNIAKHGVSLARAGDVVIQSLEHQVVSGEARVRAWGLLDGLPHCLIFTYRGALVRAISLRRSHLKEYRRHAAKAHEG